MISESRKNPQNQNNYAYHVAINAFSSTATPKSAQLTHIAPSTASTHEMVKQMIQLPFLALGLSGTTHTSSSLICYLSSKTPNLMTFTKQISPKLKSIMDPYKYTPLMENIFLSQPLETSLGL